MREMKIVLNNWYEWKKHAFVNVCEKKFEWTLGFRHMNQSELLNS